MVEEKFKKMFNCKECHSSTYCIYNSMSLYKYNSNYDELCTRRKTIIRQLCDPYFTIGVNNNGR